MRKKNLFGKKNFHVNIVYVIVFIFLVSVAGYFVLTRIESNRLEALTEARTELQAAIDNALSEDEATTYFPLAEIMPVLPNTFDEFAITSEIEWVKALSGLTNAANYTIQYQPNQTFPFSGSVPATVKTVGIEISMNVNEYQDLTSFIENLVLQERFYYVSDWNATLFLDGSASVVISLFTFYNDVTI